MLTVKNLSFSYSDQEILSDISFSVGSGQFLAILGGNGAGKTTLFKCLLGLLSPEHGEIEIQGDPIHELSREQLADRVAYVPQESDLSFNHYIIDIVEMGNQNLEGREATHRAYQILEQLGIEELALKGYLQVSGGQRQLVRLAQALMQDTPLILMDEPTNSLDYGNQLRILDQCRTLKEMGHTIIITSHEPQDVLNFCENALLLTEGKILIYDKVEDALTKETIEELYGVEVELDKTISGYPSIVLPKITQYENIEEYQKNI